MEVTLETVIDERQLASLEEKVALFLRAYSSGSFEDYLRFRNPGDLASADDKRVGQRLRTVRDGWSLRDMRPPETPVELLRAMWRLYVNSEPVITAVDWNTCAVRVRSLPEEHLVTQEWDEWAGFESHLFKEFAKSELGPFAPPVLKLAVPNRLSAVELARRDGRIVFADWRIVQKAPGRAASPIVLRFVLDQEANAWLPLQALMVVPGGAELVW